MSFRTIFGKFENQQKTFGKWFGSNFVKNIFSENCRKILGEYSEYFRFCLLLNYLLTGLLILVSPRKLGPCFKTSGLVFYGTALTSGK